MYDELLKNVNGIDTSGLVKKQIMMLRSMKLMLQYLLLLAYLLPLHLMFLGMSYQTLGIQLTTDYNVKWSDIENNYINPSDYCKFTNVKIRKDKVVNESIFNEKTKTLATKPEIKSYQNKIVKLQTCCVQMSLFFKVTLVLMERKTI